MCSLISIIVYLEKKKEKRKKKKVLPLQTSSSNYYNYNFLNFGIFEELNFWKFMTLEGAKLFDLLGLLGLGLGDSSILGFFFSFLFFWNYLMQICLLFILSCVYVFNFKNINSGIIWWV